MDIRIAFSLILLFGFVSPITSHAEGDIAEKATPAEINMVVGDFETIPVDGLTKVSVTNPDVADISDAQDNEIVILAQKIGQTTIFVWDANGKSTISVRVALQDLNMLKGRMENLLKEAEINGVSLEASPAESRIIIKGGIPKDKQDLFDKIMEPYGDQVINLAKEEANDDLVQIDMQITELSTTLSKNLGLDWNKVGAGTLSLNYTETLPATNGKFEDFFKIGDFNRTTAIMATVNALIEEGKGRVLSKPRLVVLSGKEASFLVGGEIPIRTSSTNSSGSTENVQFKQYGVNMTVTPTIRNGKIDILLKTQISDIDKANQVGNDVAFVTRDAQTQLYLENGQTIVLAGLIKHSDGEKVKGIPFLSKIPLLGAAFRNKTTPSANSDTEMVISLTPRILKDKKYATEEPVFNSPRQRAYAEGVMSRFEKTPLDRGAIKEAPAPLPKPAGVVKPAPAVSKPAPVAAAPATPAIDTVLALGDVTPYVRSVQTKISELIAYPYEAAKNNWQGTVKLKLRILNDGSLADVAVVQSSGHSIFDEDAVKTAKSSAPYGAFPSGIKNGHLVITIPIVYSQSGKSNTETVISSY